MGSKSRMRWGTIRLGTGLKARRSPSRQAPWAPTGDSLELLDALQVAYQPTISAWRHQDNIMRGDVLFLDDLSGIQNLKLKIGRIVEFDHIAFGRVKNRLDFMVLIKVPAAETDLLLAHDGLPEPCLCLTGERTVQRPNGI